MTHLVKDQGKIRHVTFSRSLARSLCAAIMDATQRAKADGMAALVLDFPNLSTLRHSELASLLEAVTTVGKGMVTGVAARAPVRTQLQELGIDRHVYVAAHAKDLLKKPDVLRAARIGVHAVILAHQSAPLLGPLGSHLPPVLLRFGGKSLLQRAFDTVVALGVTNITVSVGPGAGQVRDAALHVKPSFCNLRFHRACPFGQTSAWRAVQDAWDQGFGWAGDCLVIDPLVVATSQEVTNQLGCEAGADVTTVGQKDHNAITMLSQRAMTMGTGLPDSPLGQATQRLERVMGTTSGVHHTAQVWPVTSAQGFFDFVVAQDGQDGCMADGYLKWRTGARVHRSARVHPSADLSPQTVVGPAVDVHENSVLSGPVILERGAKIGRNTSVTASWIGPGTVVGHGLWVDRMLVGRDWAMDYGLAKTLPLNLMALSGPSRAPAEQTVVEFPLGRTA